MSPAKVKGEYPIFDRHNPFKDVGLKFQIHIITNQSGISVDSHQTDVSLAADKRA